MNIPEGLRYSTDHEWVRIEDDGRARIGITDFAQDALGDVVFVELPEVGASLDAGAVMGEVESTKSVSDLFVPAAGTVAETNSELDDAPEKLNEDPYGDGWICVMELTDSASVNELMDAAAYRELTES